MNKRLDKRHKRQVTRAREKVHLSTPDLRTPEQLRAARDLGRRPGAERNGTPAWHIARPADAKAEV